MNPRFTRLNTRVLAKCATGWWVLSFLLCLALPQGMLATTTTETALPPATIVPSSGPTSCLGLEITFELTGFDNDQSTITDVPWTVSHNGIALSDVDLDQFVQLGALGDELSDWSTSTTLAFTPLVEGCFTVGVEPYIIYAVNASQNVQPVTVIVADAPSTPVLSGFDAGPGEVPGGVLFCDGGATSGAVASFTVGEVPMSLSYTFENDLGTVLASDAVIDQVGEACDGPSINMSFNSGALGVGHYTFMATADNECGATSTSLDVEVVSFPSFALSSDPICSGEDAVVFGDLDLSLFAMSEGSLPTATAVWSNGGTDLVSNTYVTPLDGEVFSQEVTLTYALYGEEASCSSTAEINQVVHTPGSIDLVVSGGIDGNLVCEGANLTIFLDSVSNADPVETFVWTSSVPPSASSPLSLSWESFELEVTGTVTQTSVWADGTSCDNTLDFEVNVSPKPELIWTTSDATICAESDAGLIVQNITSQAIDVTWELPNGAMGTVEDIPTNNSALEGILLLPGVNFPSAGQYVVEATPTDAFGCVGDPIEGLVEVEDLPVANATFAEACEGSTVVPTGVVAGAQYAYDWSTTGNASVGQGAATATPDIDNVSCGDVVSLVVTETFLIDGEELECASEEQTVALEVVALPEPEVTTASTMCKGTDLVLDLTDNIETTGCTNQSTDYVWTLNDGSNVTTSNNAISVTLPAASFESLDVTIDAEATGTSGLTCATTALFIFDLFDNPVLPALPLDWTICDEGSLTIDGDVTLNPNGGDLAYSWNNSSVPAAFVITPAGAPSSSEAIVTLVDGTSESLGEVTLTVVDELGCFAEASTSIDILDLPEAVNAMWSDNVLCAGQVLTLNLDDITTDAALTDPATYTWSVLGSNGVTYTVSNLGNFEDEVIDLLLPDAPFDASLEPVTLDLVLDVTDGTCQSQQSWTEAVAVYPNPEVSLVTDNDVCVGTDWEGTLAGASTLSWTNSAGTTFDGVDDNGNLLLNLPWSEIGIPSGGSVPLPLLFDVASDYTVIQCASTWELTLDVLQNPEVNITAPNAICVGSTETLTAEPVAGTGQGGLTYAWSSEDDPAAFVLDAPNNAVTNIQVAEGGVIPDEGSVLLTVTDQEGCVGNSPVSTITIIELPVLGDLTVIPEAACSGTVIDVALSNITVDDGLNVDDVQYAWSADLNGVALALNGTGLNVSTTPSLADVPFQDFVGPELLSLGLTATIAGCSISAAWEDVAEVYPNPIAEADNPYMCIGQNWESTITGCDVLTVLGQNGLPDLTWSTTDPATGIDISLSPDYFEAPTGQTQNTFVFYGSVTYEEDGPTCFTETSFQMLRRNAPAYSIMGDDNSGPADDFIMCEGADLILEADVVFGGGIAYEWAQFVDDGSGNVTLQPLPSTDDNVIFVDVEASAPLDAPTLVEGVAYVTYTYNPASTPADFQCVVEEPWSFQVLPTPVISWSTEATHVCDGDDVELSVTLDAGATTLNGTGITWDWDWSGSTIDQINTTSTPSDVVTVEAQYESTLDGTFDQNFNVTVTDSYGCLSSPPTVVSITALERAVVGLERPFVCSYDTLEVLATGGDVYTWNVDFTTLDGALEEAVFFPSYAPTGDYIQSLVLFDPTHGDVIEVTGGLVYEVSDTETVTCEATEDILLVIFDEPVLEMDFSGDPAPYCDGDVLTFQDLNTDLPQYVTYDYWTSAGLDVMNEVSNTVSFSLQSEETTFEVTKSRAYFAQADTIYCSTFGTETFDVIANPVIGVDGDAGICQDGVGSVVCEVIDPNGAFIYTPTWTASSNADTSVVNLGATMFGLDVASANGVTPEAEPNLIFSVYVKDDNGCLSETVSYDMQVVATPILDITDELLEDQCSPSTDCMQVALLNEDLSGVDVLYFWDNEAGSSNDGFCVNFVNPTECPFTDSTKVTVRYEHTLVNGETVFCESSAVDSTVVNPTPLPNFSLEAPQACLDLANLNCVPVLHDTAAYNVCEGDSLSYEWFVTPLGDLIQNNLVTDDLTTPFPSICVDTAGVLNVVLEITNSYGCAQTTSNVPFTVRGLPVPELTFEQPSICLPTTVSILNSSSGAANFSMSIPGYPTYENFLSPLELDVEFPGYYNAEFTVSNTHIIDGHELTCSVDTEYVHAFEGRTPPVAEFAVLPDTIIDFVNPVVEFVNLSEGQTENIWSFGNGEGSSELDPEVEYEAAGFYNAQLQVVNEYGCTDVYSQEIEVYTDLYIYVPTAFTPDNDGLNDAWLPSIIGQDVIATYECSVFTRSGDRVFYTTDPNKAWIGGNDLSGEGAHFSSGGEVFAWRILIKKKDGQGAKTYTGHVTMVR